MELFDIPYVEERFTWYRAKGKTISKIDRFLLKRNLIEVWAVVDQRADSRDISDHNFIWFNSKKIDWAQSHLDSIMLGTTMKVLELLLNLNGQS